MNYLRQNTPHPILINPITLCNYIALYLFHCFLVSLQWFSFLTNVHFCLLYFTRKCVEEPYGDSEWYKKKKKVGKL